MDSKAIFTLEELKKQVRNIIDEINKLPFDSEAKKELANIIESHANTAYETIKRIYESGK